MRDLAARADAGRPLQRLERRWRDGATAFVFAPEEFVVRLAVLVPPPQFHLVRYAGVLAPCAWLRARVVPEPPEGNSACALGPEAGEGKGSDEMPVPASRAAVPVR